MTLPARLASTPYPKIWGTPRTAPWYPNPDNSQTGEIWFAASDQIPLLVKLLFTADKLSVQVHPNDEYARQHHKCLGKTEMWHVLRADPGAKVAIGLRESITREELREKAESGEIEHLLNWIEAAPGETFFLPAGTIHAIGAGLVLCEVQQLSDITYRLYDFKRGRELHLDHGVEVSHRGPWDGRKEPVSLGDGRDLLAECPYFRTERLTVNGSAKCPTPQKNTVYVAVEGDGLIAGQPFHVGEAWESRAGSAPFEIESSRAVFVVTSEP